ncbi:MAG: YidC/Oxa1 family membrane protein insertase [Dehalococcoidia bacterium]
MDLIIDLFHVLLVEPMTNVLVALAWAAGGNFGIAIIVFTVLMRFVTWPLTARQYKQTKSMQEMQPKIQELQKRYKGKDPKKLQTEMMALYREHGINPFGCLLPMLAQFPIWIALYQVIRVSVGEAPESLVSLSQTLYPISFIHSAVPLQTQFLYWNLGQPDVSLVLPVFVGITMYVQQKLITPAPTAATANSTAAQQQQMMLWMMPLMFGFFSLQVPAGLALYWAITNVSGIALQYFYMGRRMDWRSLLTLNPAPAQPERKPKALAVAPQPARDGPRPETTNDDEANEPVAAPSGQSTRRKRHGRRRGKR